MDLSLANHPRNARTVDRNSWKSKPRKQPQDKRRATADQLARYDAQQVGEGFEVRHTLFPCESNEVFQAGADEDCKITTFLIINRLYRWKIQRLRARERLQKIRFDVESDSNFSVTYQSSELAPIWRNASLSAWSGFANGCTLSEAIFPSVQERRTTVRESALFFATWDPEKPLAFLKWDEKL